MEKFPLTPADYGTALQQILHQNSKKFCVSADVPSFLRMHQTETLHLDIYLFLSLLLILLVVESVFPFLQFPYTSLNSVKFRKRFCSCFFPYIPATKYIGIIGIIAKYLNMSIIYYRL